MISSCTHPVTSLFSVSPPSAGHSNKQRHCADFLFQGTRDETAFCCVPTALKLYRGLGAERIRAYNSDLVVRASELLAKMWNTEILAPPSLRGAFMAAIQIPFPFSGANQSAKSGRDDQEELDVLLLTPLSHNLLREMLQRQFKIEYIKLFNFGKRVWVRISCQIYNQIEDYQTLGQVVCRIVGGKNSTLS